MFLFWLEFRGLEIIWGREISCVIFLFYISIDGISNGSRGWFSWFLVL